MDVRSRDSRVERALWRVLRLAGRGPSSRPPSQEKVVVPIEVEGGQGSARGAHPVVEVRVGRSKQVPVLLDRGSVGLHIFAPAVSTGRRVWSDDERHSPSERKYRS
jgi:hypothetical protein